MRTIYPGYETCGLYYVGVPNRKSFPLDGVHVSARIVDLVVEVQIMQFYVNPESHPVDAEYVFPLDEKAAVCGFECELPEKLLIGEVREKQEARREYNAAIARGETAALLEQDKPDIFRQKIGNIPPHSRVNIRITYVADLKVEVDGAIRFLLPTSVAPRYSPHSEYIPFSRPWHHCCGRRVWYGGPERWRHCHYYDMPFYRYRWIPERIVDRQKPCAFSLSVEIETASDIVKMECPTHDVKWEHPEPENKREAVASLWFDTEPMGKDFVLKIHQHAAHEPRVHVEVAPDGSAAAMLTMVPDFDLEPEPTEIVFLVDCSGSMSGQRIEAARRALSVFVKSLPTTCYFNMIMFGSSSVSLFPGNSVQYTSKTLERAEAKCRSLGANLGGTEILRPLKQIFGRKVACGKNRQVFVLTDGQVSNTEAVIEECRQNAHNSRVFTIGIGNQVSRALVEGMARAADGTAEFIVGAELNGSTPALEMKIINQLRIATQPALSKVAVDWGQLGSLTPPSYEHVTQKSDDNSDTTGTTGTTGTSQSDAPSKPTGENTLVNVTIDCSDTKLGEEIFMIGSVASLGQWDPSKATKLVTHEGAFPKWSGSVVLPEGEKVEFKFIKKNGEGYCAFEEIEGNRTVTAHGLEADIDCGVFAQKSDTKLDVKRTRPTPPSTPAPADATPASPSNAVGSGPMHAGPGPQHSGPQHAGPGGAPVSKFFKTGAAGKASGSLMGHRAAGYSPHGVGGGAASQALHNAQQGGALAPHVGYGNDATHAQAHGRNDDVYQAPFLPPPIFSNQKFLFFAFFAPGKVPNDKITVTAHSPEGPLTLEVPITKLETVGRTVHVLAAKALVRDLEQSRSHLHYRWTSVPPQLRSKVTTGWFRRFTARDGKGQDAASAWNLEPVTPPIGAVKRELVELGVKYQIVSAETSFVAVERWLDGRRGDSDTALESPSEAVADFDAPQLQQQQQQQQQQQFRGRLSSFNASRGGGGGGGRGGGAPPARVLPSARVPAPRLRKKGASRAAAPSGPGGYGAPPPPSAPSLSYGSVPMGGGGGEYGSVPMGGPPGGARNVGYGAVPASLSMNDSMSYGSIPSASSSSLAAPLASRSRSRSPVKEKKKKLAKSPRSLGFFKRSSKAAAAVDYADEEDDDSSDASSDAGNFSNEKKEKEVEEEKASREEAAAGPTGTSTDLINLQQFEGGFEFNAKLTSLGGVDFAKLEQAMKSADFSPLKADSAEARKLWGVAVALAIFEQRFSASSDAWQMVAEKAKTYALGVLKAAGLTDRKKARLVISELVEKAKSAF